LAGLEAHTEQIVNGICLAEYEVGAYKTDAKKVTEFFTEDAVLEIQVAEKLLRNCRKISKNWTSNCRNTSPNHGFG